MPEGSFFMTYKVLQPVIWVDFNNYVVWNRFWLICENFILIDSYTNEDKNYKNSLQEFMRGTKIPLARYLNILIIENTFKL